MTVATLNPSEDTRITSAAGYVTTNNGADADLLAGEWKTYAAYGFRILIGFDLSSIPANATVIAAKLRLYDIGDDWGTNARTMRAFRVLRNWVEGNNSAGSGATWNTYDGTNAWGTVGCSNTTTDREATEIGSIAMPQPEVAGYVEITLDVAKVQGWITGALANNGMLLQMDTELDDAHHFNSREAGSNKPEIVITYTTPEGGSPIFFDNTAIA